MEEWFQKVIRLAPPWARQILTVCGLAGAALASLHNIFAPAIDKLVTGLIDPANLTVTNLAFATLCVLGPAWLAVYGFNPHRKPINAALRNVYLVEAVMEQVNLRENERVTIRRGIVKAFADAVKQNPAKPARPEAALEAANDEIPGLVGDDTLVGGDSVVGPAIGRGKRATH